MKFFHLKIVSEAMDARKWSAKWRNWNISDIIHLSEFSRGVKSAELARNICAVYGDNVFGESMTRKCSMLFTSQSMTCKQGR